MATKSQINARFQGHQYRPRENPSVQPVQAPGLGSLPATPLDWHPQQSGAVQFMEKLFGQADTVAKLAHTEAGKQYQEAKARALRGDYTVDDSGLITFRGAQQKALSEVEGAVDAETESNRLMEFSENLKRQLASNPNLTPAQRVAAYTDQMRKQSYNGLSSAKDKDYLIAKGARVHDTANRLINAYRASTVNGELQAEKDKVASAFTADLNRMPSSDPETRLDYTKACLSRFADNWTKVTGGQPVSTGKEYLTQFVRDRVAKGDRDTLEQLKDYEISKGVTLSGLGVITQAHLEAADDRAISNIRKENAMVKAREEAFLRGWDRTYTQNLFKTRELHDKTGEEYETAQSELFQYVEEQRKLIQESDALTPGTREAIMKRMDQMDVWIGRGGAPVNMTANELEQMTALRNSGNLDAVYDWFRANPQKMAPPDLAQIQTAAFAGTDESRQTLRDNTEWTKRVYSNSSFPMLEPGESQEQFKMRMFSTINSLFEDAKKKDPQGSPASWRSAAEAEFRKTYPALNEQQKTAAEVSKKAFMAVRSNLNTVDGAEVTNLLSSVKALPSTDQEQIRNALSQNTTLPASSLKNLEHIIKNPENAKKFFIYNPVAEYDYFPLNPKYKINSVERFSEKAASAVFVKNDNGMLEQRPWNKISIADEGKIMTGPISNKAKFLDDDGTVRNVWDIKHEEELKKVVTRQRTPMRTGGTPENPIGHDLSDWEYGNEMELPNFSNQDLPLKDHYVFVRRSGLKSNQPFQMKYSDMLAFNSSLPEGDSQRVQVLSTPFDPNRTVAVQGGGWFGRNRVIKLKDLTLGTFSRQVEFMSQSPLEIMSFDEQVKLLSNL